MKINLNTGVGNTKKKKIKTNANLRVDNTDKAGNTDNDVDKESSIQIIRYESLCVCYYA